MVSGRHSPRVRHLAPRAHTIYRLTEQLSLVFKPAGHVEAEHSHPYGQSLRVLAGRLEVEIGRQRVTLGARSDRFALAAHLPHKTTAVGDTWLLVERGDEG